VDESSRDRLVKAKPPLIVPPCQLDIGSHARWLQLLFRIDSSLSQDLTNSLLKPSSSRSAASRWPGLAISYRRRRCAARAQTHRHASDPFQCAERVTCCVRTRRSRDQRVALREPISIAPHLSLPPCDGPVAIFLTITNQRAGDNRHRQT
jgi:hypothetical protein